ncbi:hypothetical protein RvY_06131 [Ramazzottius varieornatus]|uniref:Uncharacterized protein n=1 Tax=Ramazzottius varieornatus TaxID=947166 RepID=A0A1D1V0I3_RAMVA|nr:hypothetical protein RvY_06131 [Ramazzottius varieornatus]
MLIVIWLKAMNSLWAKCSSRILSAKPASATGLYPLELDSEARPQPSIGRKQEPRVNSGSSQQISQPHAGLNSGEDQNHFYGETNFRHVRLLQLDCAIVEAKAHSKVRSMDGGEIDGQSSNKTLIIWHFPQEQWSPRLNAKIYERMDEGRRVGKRPNWDKCLSG